MNIDKKKVVVDKTVYTFAYLRSISWFCLKRAKKDPRGSNLLCASSMVFTALSLEAYLNHLGSNSTNFWDSVERKLSPREKLDTLSSILDLSIDYGTRPFQTFNNMFYFRNALAHGKTEKLTVESIQVLDFNDIPELPKTAWEESISKDTASRYLDDAKEMVKQLNVKAGLEDYLLWTPDNAEWTIESIST